MLLVLLATPRNGTVQNSTDPSPIPAAVHLSDSWQPGYQTLGKDMLHQLREQHLYFNFAVFLFENFVMHFFFQKSIIKFLD